MKLALSVFLLCLLAAGASRAEYVGVVKTVKGAPGVERAGSLLEVRAGTRLSEGDRLVTGADDSVGVTLRDDTLLTVGPRTTFALDRYAFDQKTHAGYFTGSVVRGVLYVITGLIAKRSPESFVLKTRISTMGVRGTEFVVEVEDE